MRLEGPDDDPLVLEEKKNDKNAPPPI